MCPVSDGMFEILIELFLAYLGSVMCVLIQWLALLCVIVHGCSSCVWWYNG